MVSSVFYFVSYYLILAIALYFSPRREIIKRITKSINKYQIAIIVFAALFSQIFVYLTVSRDNTIYTWDWAGYWKNSIIRTDQLFSLAPKECLRILYHSINNDDYNLYLPSVIALPLHLFGYEFVEYVTVVSVFFLMPAVLLQGVLAVRILPNKNPGAVYTIAVVLGFLFIGPYRSLLRGMIDVAILLPISILILFLLDYDFSKVSHVENISIAAMLLLMWISRRYTLFFIVGYVFTMGYKAIVFFMKNRNKGAIVSVIGNFIEIGGISLLVLIAFLRNFLLRTLQSNS
jgi:hypothetical protein